MISTAKRRPALRTAWANPVTGWPPCGGKPVTTRKRKIPMPEPPLSGPTPDAKGLPDAERGRDAIAPLPLNPERNPALQGERYASIDVGTNSVKMIVADLGPEKAQRLFEQAIITRLGEGMQAPAPRLRETAIR